MLRAKLEPRCVGDGAGGMRCVGQGGRGGQETEQEHLGNLLPQEKQRQRRRRAECRGFVVLEGGGPKAL